MPSLASDLAPQPVGTGLLVTLVGYSSTVAVVIRAMATMGASEAQVASGLLLWGLAQGAVGLWLALRTRMPVALAWSTPGMALMLTMPAPAAGYPAVVGALAATGLLIMLAGLWTRLGALVAAIPRPIASGMLGGILLQLCLMPFQALREQPRAALAVVLTWLVVGRLQRLWAAPAALVVALGAMALEGTGPGSLAAWPGFSPVVPVFDPRLLVSLALPLFVVTMASQNIPGLAVLSTYGYHPPVRPIFLGTGAASAVTALFGAPTTNLAAITAALCAGPDAHPDPSRRYVAAAAAALGYMALGPLAGVVTLLVAHGSPVLIEAVAGLALIGALGASLQSAVTEETARVPALLAFLVTASGLSVAGIGSAFWGLAAGLMAHGLYRLPLRRA